MEEKEQKQTHILGRHTIEDFIKWANVEVGDMVCIDVGLSHGFPIGYLKSYTSESITLTRHRPESRHYVRSLPWNKEDKPITYEVKDMSCFYGLTKLGVAD